MKKCVLVILTCSLIAVASLGNKLAQDVVVDASRSYNAQSFTYTRVFKEKELNHTVYSITYPSPVESDFPENNVVPAELYVPDGMQKDLLVPAVVCMHILNGDFALCRMMCSRLSEAGMVALFFKQPFYGSRGGSEGRRKLLKSVDVLIKGFEQSTADARRAFDIVQSLPYVDPNKCGVTGISLGAIRAGALCAYEPRINRAYLSLVAGDLKQVILNARETRDLRAFLENASEDEQQRIWDSAWQQDPLNAVPQLKELAKEGRLRMVRAENDEIMPPECSLKLFDAIGYPESQICLPGMGHYSAMAGLTGIMDDLTAFFAEDMPTGWTPPVRTNSVTAVSLLGNLLKDLSAFLIAQPKDGCSHMAGVKVEFETEKKKHRFNFNLSLGTQGKFKIDGNFPEVGAAGLGRGVFPWLIGSTNVFCGTVVNETSEPTLTALIGDEALIKYRMAMGLVAGVSFSPDLINNYAKCSTRIVDNKRVLILESVHKKIKGDVEISFDSSGTQPLSARWDLAGSRGTIDVTHWQINAVAHDALFEPANNLVRQDVRSQDVLQMFASVFRFLIDKTDN